ncbi:MAG: hypothetical protein IPJ34_25960 [Myxococcales bacterium]|nr:hypothetical protein [Myxococcales bacterium]
MSLRRTPWAIFGAGLSALALAACSDSAASNNTSVDAAPDGVVPDSGNVTDSGGVDSTTDATPDAPTTPTRALIGANPALTSDFQGEEGYWYSRYAMSTISMASGMGEMVDMASASDPFAPLVMAAMPAMIDMANDCAATASGCTPPVDPATGKAMPQVASSVMMDLHPTIVTRIYNSGDPSLANVFDAAHPIDTLNMRLVPSAHTASKTTTSAYGWLAVKETEWAKQFHVDDHFGAPGPTDTKGLALPRLFGEMIFAEALMQTKVLLDDTVDMSTTPPSMKTPAKFDWSDPRGNYVVLLALADLATTLRGDATKGNVLCTADGVCSASNRYRAMGNMMAPMILGTGKTADDLGGMFLMAANMLSMNTAMFPTTPADLKTGAVAVQSLTWLASVEMDASVRADVKTRLRGLADFVLVAPKPTSVDQAAALRALVEAYRVLGDTKYKSGANAAWTALLSKYDAPHGRWTDVSTYTGEDLAFLFGSLNSFGTYNATRLGVSAADQDRASNTLLDAFESTMDIGGFQLAAPPASSPFIAAPELKPSPLQHRYPTMPMPSAVTPSTKGNGVAPVCAKSITWSGTGWSVDRSEVDVAQCMHLAMEMMWFHSDEVNGFPVVP